MAKILLIETATGVCSAAIAIDGTIVALEEVPETQQHAALLTLQIHRCTLQAGIKLSELDAIGVSSGPGAYTSLRVGISVAKGICYALDKPLIAVDTLQALAYASQIAIETAGNPMTEQIYFIPMIDARRKEVWTGIYDARLQPVSPAQPLILENNSFIDYITTYISPINNIIPIASGNGTQKLLNVTFYENTVVSPIKNCSAQYLSFLVDKKLQVNDFKDIAYFEPMYMKPPNITVSKKSAWHEK